LPLRIAVHITLYRPSTTQGGVSLRSMWQHTTAVHSDHKSPSSHAPFSFRKDSSSRARCFARSVVIARPPAETRCPHVGGVSFQSARQGGVARQPSLRGSC